ncbi:hypothetical protein [Numidum massiliense]|uniref:hypothetical protein n=1 Tax=Numidum massiliense TaxID=1522315 RepID=UPI0006D59E43|nr:hypothetical protein [Numidum massiliense]
MKSIKGIFSHLVVWIGIALLAVVILGVVVLTNMGVLVLASKINPLNIELMTSLGVFWFGIGMTISILPSLVIGIALVTILESLFPDNNKLKFIIEEIISFLYVLGYIYVLDYLIKDISLSRFGLISLALVYSVIMAIIENTKGPRE